MPIRAENRERYPADWKAVSHRIRFERAAGRCECAGECGIDHGDRCQACHGEANPMTGAKVILTTAHLDHAPENCADSNLKAMCQRCHLRYDRVLHAVNARATRFRKVGQDDLFTGAA